MDKKKKALKSVRPRLYNDVHELCLGGMDSNCYMTVIGEFAGGHEGPKDFDGKRLTNDEWFAVLQRSGVSAGLQFFGGVNATIDEKYPFGQEAFRKFLERNGVPVKKVQNKGHTAYIANLTPEFFQKGTGIKVSDYYRDDPTAEEWGY